MLITKIKFVGPGEKVRFNQEGIKYFGERAKNQEFTVKKVIDTFFDGIIIHQVVELDESPLKTSNGKMLSTGWLELPHDSISLQEVERTMPELIVEFQRVNEIWKAAVDNVRKKRMSEKTTNNQSPSFF